MSRYILSVLYLFIYLIYLLIIWACVSSPFCEVPDENRAVLYSNLNLAVINVRIFIWEFRIRCSTTNLHFLCTSSVSPTDYLAIRQDWKYHQ
ncbi:hypothetical protein F5B17DRAFT_403916 [Nemania serpens]|nr:hypothetical protein F5B17DRAFT_403916 [Nemania serpens]